MSKTYKGYELIKAIADGEIKEGTKIEVHSLIVLDCIKTIIWYKNKRLNWDEGSFTTEYLFDNNYYFRILEDEIDIQNIEEIGAYCNIIEKTENEGVLWKMIQSNAKKIDELVEAVKQLDRKIGGK